MKIIKQFVVAHFESCFVLAVLIAAFLINYFVAYKLVFLNFYFIPVLLAAYYLDLRRSMLGAVACVLIVAIYLLVSPRSFDVPNSGLARAMSVFTWSCFLLLTSIVVGRLSQKLQEEVSQTNRLNASLLESQAQLREAGQQLKDHADNLERKVAERTDSLEKSKHSIEDLKKRVEDALYSTMDPAVVKLIIEKRLRTEKRRVSILFSDLRGFTRYSEEKRPELVVNDLNKFLAEMEEVLLAYHGHIDKYMGDGIMAEFGAPVDYEQQELMAVMSGLKMQQRVSRGRYPWQMRVGISTGEPIVGLIGKHKQSYTAIGDAVNRASRYEELCTPGEVTIGASTYEAVSRFFDCRKKILVDHEGLAHFKDAAALRETLTLLDEHPDDPALLKKAAWLFLDAKDPVNAQTYLRRALELDPGDDRVKVAFAEASVKVSKSEKIAIRGTNHTSALYEVVGLKDPLLDREKIPQKLYDAFARRVAEAGEYSEDLILPVECLDGSVGHGRAVGFLSFALADALNLPDQDKKDILQAGYLADIGKSIIPHHLLNRKGSLSKTEFEEVVKHSRESVRLLKTMGYENEALFAIIAAHHESPTGSGYPEGIPGDKVPLAARIVAVADAYDALTSWRPYRNRWDFRAAVAELRRDCDKGKFDPYIVDHLARLLQIQA